jgi:hypothetical protein
LKVDDKGDDEDPRDLKINEKSSQCVCELELCVNVVDLHIMRKYPNHWELQKIVIVR